MSSARCCTGVSVKGGEYTNLHGLGFFFTANNCSSCNVTVQVVLQLVAFVVFIVNVQTPGDTLLHFRMETVILHAQC